MPYAVDERGAPIFFVSSLAMHTQNMREDPHVSLFVCSERAVTDPLASARVTLVGLAQPVPASEVSATYLARHEEAQQWQNFGDFSYYRLHLSNAYFVGGFGVMGWISAEEYGSACPTT